MISHLQYHLNDGFNSFLDDPKKRLVLTEEDKILETRAQRDGKEPRVKFSDVIKSFLTNDRALSPIDLRVYPERAKLNEALLETYPLFNENYEGIKSDVDKFLESYVREGGTIRELIYRMNTKSDRERQFLNRGLKVTSHNDNFFNHVGSYKLAGRDDMVNSEIMLHEVEVLLLYLLKGSNRSIKFNFKVKKAFIFMCKLIGFIDIMFNGKSLDATHSNRSLNLRYITLQSLFDSSYTEKIPQEFIFSKKNLLSLIKNEMDNTLGEITIGEKKFSLANLVIKLFIENRFFEEEAEYNLCRIHMGENDLIIKAAPGDIKVSLGAYYVSESFRRIFQTLMIAFYELLLFNFMQFVDKEVLNHALENEETKLKNPFDDKLIGDRTFLRDWLYIEENCNKEALFNLFNIYLDKIF